ncbi:MAG TPA: 4-alpha-glucanotransferase [Candidatus Binatia bacterium]|jgi:4-alpha-glucanotransferase|nr:4-alpha-glucanotransferase [Candidatus Binatia bacterium]
MAERDHPSAGVPEALRALDVRALALVVHDASFPADEDEDVGRGAPGSHGAQRFLRFVRGLGFTGLQLGPDGQTPPDDPSPYRSAALPKNPLSIALSPLAEAAAWGEMLPVEALRAAVRARPEGARAHVHYAAARAAHDGALRAAFRVFRTAATPAMAALRDEAQRFEREQAWWLERYELFEPLAAAHGTRDPRRWPAVDAALWRNDGSAARRAELRARHADDIAYFRFTQLVADVQRRRFAAVSREIGLSLFADLPIGLAPEDVWCRPELFLDDWRMGAPPSRTNPEGQAWDYPVFDPRRRADVLRFLEGRLDRVFATADGLRIDHPHGLVCPWVYDAWADDPGSAVRQGGRLFESPDRLDLARFAIVGRDQLDPSLPRHADAWVTSITPAQEDAYAVLMDAVLAVARRRGLGAEGIVCEVLSTLPLPLARILTRHGLGRFRVTQKAALDDPQDVYRSENARPEDWMMVGTHDTRSIWAVVESWRTSGQLVGRAAYLASRLAPREDEREAMAQALVREPGLLVHALFADLFASPARHVMIFFPDLFGLRESYNVPGTFGPHNWRLRVPPDWERVHTDGARRLDALDLRVALAMALRARGVVDGDLLHGLR